MNLLIKFIFPRKDWRDLRLCGRGIFWIASTRSGSILIPSLEMIWPSNFPSVHLKLPAYQLLQNFSTNKDVVQNRIDQIVELDETRRTAFETACKNQSNIKKSFDKCSRSRSLQVGDMVLLWDRKNEKPGKHKKFDSLWLGPYIIRDIAGPNSFHLSRLDGEPLHLPANGQMLKLFFRDDIWCHGASSVLYFYPYSFSFQHVISVFRIRFTFHVIS